MIEAWEMNPENPDLYQLPKNSKSQHDLFLPLLLTLEADVRMNEIHCQLAEEEHRKVEQGNLGTDGSPLTFIVLGFAIEDSQ